MGDGDADDIEDKVGDHPEVMVMVMVWRWCQY